VVVGRRLAALAESAGVTPARLAVAFALAPSSVASVLFGATRPEQVQENVAALELVDHLDEPTWRELRWIGAELD
jgi:aryl-alcohol dehydrogenase-like predicted oxidoreductase